VKTTPGKVVTKVGEKKIVLDFLGENGLKRPTKTIPVGIFADITFSPFFGGWNLGVNFFVQFFFVKMVKRSLHRRSLTEFLLS